MPLVREKCKQTQKAKVAFGPKLDIVPENDIMCPVEPGLAFFRLRMRDRSMFVVSVGNAFDGLHLFVAENNQPFTSIEAASTFGDNHFDDYLVIPLHSPQSLTEDENKDQRLDDAVFAPPHLMICHG